MARTRAFAAGQARRLLRWARYLAPHWPKGAKIFALEDLGYMVPMAKSYTLASRYRPSPST